MDDDLRIWRTAVPALVCALPNVALCAHSVSVLSAAMRRDWGARALRVCWATGLLLGSGAASAVAGLGLLTSVLTNKQTSIDRVEVVPFVCLYA